MMSNPEVSSPAQKMILLGRIAGTFGVRGEVKIESWTEPRAAIFGYQPWMLRCNAGGDREITGVRGRGSDRRLIAVLPGICDRDAAEALRGAEIWIPRTRLPAPAAGEYYWVDLEGMRVMTVAGVDLGTVSHLFATGANDVLVVQGGRERMLPFVQPDYIRSVDYDSGMITVDWDPEF